MELVDVPHPAVRSRLLHEKVCNVRDCPFFCGAAVREDDVVRGEVAWGGALGRQ